MSIAVSEGRISIGEIIRQTVALLSRNRRVFGMLGLLLGFLPTFAFGLLRVTGVTETPDNAFGGGTGESVATTIAGLFLQASLIAASISTIKGRPLGLNESLEASRRHWLPLFGIAMLAGLGIVVGTLLFIVPGVLLYLCWLPAPAVRVVEKKGVFESFGRSVELTRYNRLRLLGLTLLTILIFGAVFLVIGGMLVIIPQQLLVAKILTELVFTPLAVMIMSVVTTVGVAATYAELRRAKGSPVEDVAAVFD